MPRHSRTKTSTPNPTPGDPWRRLPGQFGAAPRARARRQTSRPGDVSVEVTVVSGHSGTDLDVSRSIHPPPRTRNRRPADANADRPNPLDRPRPHRRRTPRPPDPRTTRTSRTCPRSLPRLSKHNDGNVVDSVASWRSSVSRIRALRCATASVPRSAGTTRTSPRRPTACRPRRRAGCGRARARRTPPR